MSEERERTRVKLWDPADEITRGSGRLLWFLLGSALIFTVGPSFVSITLKPLGSPFPNKVFYPDFFQDYASARNFRNGMDVYTKHELTTKLYLGGEYPETNVSEHFRVNAHPPSSIFLFIPLAGLDFAGAFRAWNLASLLALAIALLLVARHLGIGLSVWSIAPAISLVLLCSPLWTNLLNGQYSPILIYLLVIVWAADRQDRQTIAGVFLALAVAVKLIPALLLLAFVFRRRWRIVWSAVASSAIIGAFTIFAFGNNVYLRYVVDIYPKFAWFKNSWLNASIAGFWSRLFDTAPEVKRNFELSRPLLYAPHLATVATLVCDVLIAALLARAVSRARSRRGNDLTFSLAIVSMLLISPLTWPHYLLMLVFPFMIAWRYLAEDNHRRRILLALAFFTLFLSPEALVARILSDGVHASPIVSLTLFSMQFYVLILLFMYLYNVTSLAEPRIAGVEGWEAVSPRFDGDAGRSTMPPS